MMEQDQEQKHICKLCNKSFLSGTVLGGHMRSHISMNSTEADAKLKNSKMDFQSGGLVGYGLRENPKKSCKISYSNHVASSMQEHLCKVCGKGFESPRSLFGHMRHHAKRGTKGIHCKECGKGFGTLRALTGHMRLHSARIRVSNEPGNCSSQYNGEAAGPVRRKRSKRMRYKITEDSSFSDLNESSSFTEIDQEEEELAISLMMLSRGVRNWDGFSSVTESSDNNSLSFELKSLHQNKRIVKIESGNLVCDGDEPFKMKKPRVEMLDTCASDAKNGFCDMKVSEISEFDLEVASDEEQKVELKVPIVRFYKGVELQMPKLADDCEKENNPIDVEFRGDLVGETRLDVAGLESIKYNSSKKAKFDDCDPEFGGNSRNKIICTGCGSEIFHDSGKKDEFKCRTCNKVFRSHHAFGGHCTIHKTIRSCFASNTKSCEENIQSNTCAETEASCKLVKLTCDENLMEEVDGETVTSYELKKSKGHECPICFKVFASGQALGGHKKAHSMKNPETREEQNIESNQELNGDIGFKPWCVGSDHNREPLVGLISN